MGRHRRSGPGYDPRSDRFPDISAGDTLSGPFAQAWSDGALRMSRGEGIWYARRQDVHRRHQHRRRRARPQGPRQRLGVGARPGHAAAAARCSSAATSSPHTIPTTSPSARAAAWCCARTAARVRTDYGPGARLVGLTRAGESFHLAKNNVELTSTQIANAGKPIAEGDYRDSEFCGACWSPNGRTLFVNIQTPGITVAITGPWERGSL